MARSTSGSRLLYRRPGPFLKHPKELFRFVLEVVALILVSGWLGHNFLLEPPAKWYHDFQLRRRTKIQERITRIVRIDSKDHEDLFGGNSPLSGPRLVQAACALVSRGAAVVVVDLDTSSAHAFPAGFRLPQSPVPIVWAVEATWDGDDRKAGARKSEPVLGGRLAAQPPYGIADMPTDFDGVTRFWRRFDNIGGYPRPTLGWAAIQQYCRAARNECPKEEGHSHDRPVPFTMDVQFQDIRLSEFLAGPPAGFPASCPSLSPDPRLKDRIVLLGGTYSRTDLHETPWGPRYGVELMAMAIEQVFDPVPMHEVAEYFLIGLEIVLGFLVAAIHHWIRPVSATVFTLILLPLGVIVSAEMMFLLGDVEVGVVPFIVAMLIHQLVGSAERAEHIARRAEHAQTLGGVD